MEHSVYKFAPEEFDILEKALKQKAKYLKANGIENLPPIFATGDNVGFFHGLGAADHKTGVIIAEGERHVTIESVDGMIHEVSPFLLFALPKAEAGPG